MTSASKQLLVVNSNHDWVVKKKQKLRSYTRRKDMHRGKVKNRQVLLKYSLTFLACGKYEIPKISKRTGMISQITQIAHSIISL